MTRKWFAYVWMIWIFLWMACDQTPKVIQKKKNLIIVTLDTTRASRLGCYGYEGQTTPSIDTFAQDAILFENVVAPVPLTLPSHSTLFTGIYPIGHGVRANVAFQLPDEVQTLAEILKNENYETSAFVSAMVLNKQGGLGQGFDHYDQKFPQGQPERNAEATIRAVQKWLQSRRSEKPFFLWIHLFDPHFPHKHPEPYKSRFPTSPYNGELAFMDAEIGKFFQRLKTLNLYQDSVITVVGDHGESLGDHGENSHGYFAYDCTLKVPWLLKLPENLYAKQRIKPQVRMVDVMPTLLHFLGVSIGTQIQGTNLAPFLDQKSSFPELVAYAETYYPWYQYGFTPIEVLRTSTYKLIDTLPVELYDLRTDPNENKNLSQERPEIVKQLKDQLRVQKETFSTSIHAEVEPNEKTLCLLGALGYVSSRLENSKSTSMLSAKENLKTHENIMKIYAEMEQANFPKAQDSMTQVLLTNPELPIAQELQLEVFLRTKQYSKAIPWIHKLLKKYPDEPPFLFKLAGCYIAQKNEEEGIMYLKKALALAPNYEEAYHLLYSVYVQLNRFEEAIQYNQTHHQPATSSNSAWFWIGRIQEAQGDIEKAEKSYLQAIQQQGKQGSAYYRLAKINEQKQNTDLVIQYYQSALLTLPEDDERHEEILLALGNLVIQDPLRAIAYFEQALELNSNRFETRKKLIELYFQIQKKVETQVLIQEGFKQSLPTEELFSLIVLSEKTENFTETFKQLESFLLLNPFHKEALLFSGKLNLRFQRKEEAIKNLVTFLELSSPQDPQYLKVTEVLKKLQAK